MSCGDVGLPIPVHQQVIQCDYDMREEHDIGVRLLEMLNDEQRHVADRVLEDIRETKEDMPPKCRAYFMEGPGGSGKTTVYNTLISLCRGKGYKVNH